MMIGKWLRQASWNNLGSLMAWWFFSRCKGKVIKIKEKYVAGAA
jgi:hypothetical protein